MHVELQPLTKIRIANAADWVIQPRSERLNVTNYTGGVFRIDIEAITGDCTFRLLTSFGEDATEQTLISLTSVGSTTYKSNPNDPSLPLLARDVFWRVNATGADQEITFRVRAVLKNF